MGNENVGRIEYDARINTKKLKSDAREIEATAQQTGNSIDSGVTAGTAKAEAALNKFKQIAIGAFIAIGAAAIAAGKQSISNAIDLSESINAVEKTFGDASAAIFKFGATADKQAGLSKAAFNSAVVPIGAMLQNVGLSADTAADSSINLAKRASDLASVFNTSLGDALTAIQAGLRGEADPLERFGVGLSEANVEAYALAKGIKKADKEMTAAEKTTARLGLFFDQTARFAGDFADTSDQAANKSRILAARYENLSAQIGTRLIPVYDKLLSVGEYLLNNFDNIVRSVRDGFMSAIPTIAALGAAFVSYQAVVITMTARTTAMTAAQVALNLAMRLNPLGLVAGAAAALVVGYVNVVNSSNATTSATDRLRNAQNILTQSTNAAKDAQDRLKGALVSEEGATLAVERAQRSYNNAVSQFGPRSLEAREAAYHLKRAKDDLAAANANVRDRTNEANQAEQNKKNAAAEVVNANNAVKNSAYAAAGGYQAWAQAIREAAAEDRKSGKLGIGKNQVKSTFGIPGRAMGGSVSANHPYFVGENRDGSLNKTSELFVPRTAGTIINSQDLQSALGGGKSSSVVINQQNTIQSEIDMNVINRSLTWQLRRA